MQLFGEIDNSDTDVNPWGITFESVFNTCTLHSTMHNFVDYSETINEVYRYALQITFMSIFIAYKLPLLFLPVAHLSLVLQLAE